MSDSHFDRVWEQRLKETGSTGYVPGENLRIDKALSVIGSGGRILDIGCGTGTMLVQLKNQFDETCGIDVSANAVQAALQRGVKAKALDINASPLPYADGYFDVVTVLSTLQYFVDLDRTLNECHRVLVPNGFLVMSVPNMRALWRIGKLLFTGMFPRVSMDIEGYDGISLHSFTFADLEHLLIKHSFRVLQAHGIFCLPRLLDRAGDSGAVGWAKRELFSAEVFIRAVKI